MSKYCHICNNVATLKERGTERPFCGTSCQKQYYNNVEDQYMLVEGKREREETKRFYWAGSGKYQELFDFMMDALGKLVPDANYRVWYERDENKMWRFFNAMAGVYYEKSNSGLGLDSAIENNRTPGVHDREDLRWLAFTLGAPKVVLDFIREIDPSDQDYEDMMDATILFVEEKLFKHKNQMMLAQVFRQKGLGKQASEILARRFSEIKSSIQ